MIKQQLNSKVLCFLPIKLIEMYRLLVNMFGTQGDGIHDRLLHFVTPMDGAYFFAPNEEVLEEILED